MITAQFEPHFKSWRVEARRLLIAGIEPEHIQWSEASESLNLFSMQISEPVVPIKKSPTVPPEFLKAARFVSLSRDDGKWALLYRILFRLQNDEPELLNILIDSDILKFNDLYKSVKRDLHKMHAFVRFKEVEWQGEQRYVAWHRPEHPCLEEGAQFFVRRFGDKPWSIFTPDSSAHWDGMRLTFSEGIPQNQFKFKDDFDELWKSYYASIFNPARIKIKAMRAEMAPKYWESLPEIEIMQELVRQAPQRLQEMAKKQNIQAKVPDTKSLQVLKQAAKVCTACPLYSHATQTVFGEGPEDARIFIVGEQPGDQEDLSGRLFVGPAGEMLNRAFSQAGLNRESVYLTNAVKHFKWRPAEGRPAEGSSKARIHQKPTGTEMHACRPWLEAEINHVKPDIIVALGITAATSVLGRLPKIGSERGKIIKDNPYAKSVIISWHPAAILRSFNQEELDQRLRDLVEDLKLAAKLEESI